MVHIRTKYMTSNHEVKFPLEIRTDTNLNYTYS